MVQLSFPDFAYPGQRVTIHATTTAKSSGTIVSFSIGVFALVDGQLMKTASQTIVANAYVAVGEKWRSSLAVAIPADAQCAPLTGTITEVWQQAPNYSSSYYATPYYNMPYYTQNSRDYHVTARAPDGVISVQTPSGDTIVLNPQVALALYPMPYYTQNSQYYDYNTQQQTSPFHVTAALPNGVVSVQTPSGDTIILNPQVGMGLYYPLYYPPNCLPTQVTSQQTFPLTHVLGCYP